MSFIDGILPSRDALRMERHLEACPLCRKAYEEEVELVSAFAMDPSGRAGDDFVGKVLAGIEAPGERPALSETRDFVWRPWPALVAVCLLVVTAILAKTVIMPEGRDWSSHTRPFLAQFDATIDSLTGSLTQLSHRISLEATALFSGSDSWFETSLGITPLTLTIITVLALLACLVLVWRARTSILKEVKRI